MKNSIGKYRWYKHHAWAGLAILSIVVVIRSIFIIPNWIFVSIVLLLILYVTVALVGTYRYSKSILRQSGNRILVNDGMEKARLKLEKKRVKALYKAEKKRK
jgi:hypothetical protein